MKSPSEFPRFFDWIREMQSVSFTDGSMEVHARSWFNYWDRVRPLKNATVVYLERHPAATSDEVTQAMRNVLPYASFLSQAIKDLIQEGRLRAVLKKKGRGRPATFYSLT